MSTRRPPGPGARTRLVALDALDRIDPGGAYANLLMPEVLERSGLEARDRHFVTQLVYGTTRRRRACDFLVDRFLTRELDPRVRNALRLGAYQLHFLEVAPHAAVGATVEVAPRAARGLVNAVLRKVASNPVVWPDDATRLSYPDWVLEVLRADLGEEEAARALEVMNTAPPVTERADGYIQDLASQWVAEAVGAQAGERVADLCAAPGGKATALAATGATVIASDVRERRVGLVVANARERVGVAKAERVGLAEAGTRDRVGGATPGVRAEPADGAASDAPSGAPLSVLVADATRPPLAPGSLDRVLVDAPCSGLGTLRRRPDARWRLDPAAPGRLGTVQRAMVDAAVRLLRPGGHLVYSVCTLTDAETSAIDQHLAAAHPALEVVAPPGAPWQLHGRGARLLPQAADTDGMYLLHLRAPT